MSSSLHATVPIEELGSNTATNPDRMRIGRLSDLFLRAGRKTFWPLVDQGVVSAGNFLTLVIVARALPARSDYGTFGLVLEAIFYLNTLQAAVITYPLTIKGACADPAGLRRLASAALAMTLFVVAIPAALAGLGIAALGGKLALGLAGASAFVAWQIQEIVRRALMAHFHYARAAWGDALRYLGTAACVFLMWRHGSLTLTNVFYVIAAFAAVGAVVQTIQVGPRAVRLHDVISVTREFFFTGRWVLLSSLSAIVISLCGVWTISFFHGNDFVGQFYAIANFTKPVNLMVITMCGLVTQYAARVYSADGIHAAGRIALKLSIVAAGITVPYLLLLVVVPGPALRLLYGANSHFRDPTGELALRIFAISFILFVLLALSGAFLNGINRTRENFYAQLANSIATLTISFPLTIRYGLLGLVGGGVITAAAQLATILYFLRKATRVG